MSYYDKRISVVKAICIILMVVGHSGCPVALNKALYLFHMPCFFFISGFLLKDKYLDDMLHFFKRKVKSYWIPFVKWSLVFLLLHNVFYHIHFYRTEYGRTEYLDKLFHILTMTGSEQLLGGYWFLKELLYASIISLLGLKLCHQLFHWKEIRNGIFLIAIFLILSYILGIVPFKIPTVGHRTMLACAYFMVGYSFHKTVYRKYHNLWVGISAFIVLGIISLFFGSSMDVTGVKTIAYFSASLIGIFALLNIAGCISGVVQDALNYVGQKTLYILTFHFISFKLVSLLLVMVFDLPIERLQDFPIINTRNGSIDFVWMIYTTFGVVVPVVLWKLSLCWKGKNEIAEQYNKKK
mgnify:CR=1 FL=1